MYRAPCPSLLNKRPKGRFGLLSIVVFCKALGLRQYFFWFLDTTTAGEAEATVTPPKTESGPLPSWQREKVAAGPGLAPGYPTGKMVMVNDAYNAQMNLMVDTEACREAFRLYDKEDTGTIVKEVSTEIK